MRLEIQWLTLITSIIQIAMKMNFFLNHIQVPHLSILILMTNSSKITIINKISTFKLILTVNFSLKDIFGPNGEFNTSMNIMM